MTHEIKRKWFIGHQYNITVSQYNEIYRRTGEKNFTQECVENCYRKAVDIVNHYYNTECIYDIPWGKGHREVIYIATILLEMCYDLAEEE